MTRAVSIALVLLAACGDSGGGGGKPPAPPKPKTTAKKPEKKATLNVYPKVEDQVPVAERGTIRHVFVDRDFQSDASGMENRDPFRSYVINITGTIGPETPTIPVVATEVCTKKQQIAPDYNLRDMRLVGIVSRGLSKFALFQDSADLGCFHHACIVHRGDCLGREKARVKDIGAGFVTLEIMPEQIANQAPKPPEERSIPLYPEDYKLNDTGTDTDQGDQSAPPPTMPTTPTAPPSGPVMPDSPDPQTP